MKMKHVFFLLPLMMMCGVVYGADVNPNAENAAQIIDSLNNVIQQITTTVPEKGSGADSWYGWIAAGALVVYNFVQFIIGRKKKK